MRIQKRWLLSPRPAFTLVELIVVIAIIAGLAALIVLIFPRLQDSQRVAKGGDVLQGQLFLAKQMALRDQLPRGVGLLLGPTAGQYTSLQLVEQPLPYTVGQATGIANFGNNIYTNSTASTTPPGKYDIQFTANASFG